MAPCSSTDSSCLCRLAGEWRSSTFYQGGSCLLAWRSWHTASTAHNHSNKQSCAMPVLHLQFACTATALAAATAELGVRKPATSGPDALRDQPSAQSSTDGSSSSALSDVLRMVQDMPQTQLYVAAGVAVLAAVLPPEDLPALSSLWLLRNVAAVSCTVSGLLRPRFVTCARTMWSCQASTAGTMSPCTRLSCDVRHSSCGRDSTWQTQPTLGFVGSGKLINP